MQTVENRIEQRLILGLVFIYGALVLVLTVINRGVDLNIPKFIPFWSYKEWFLGNQKLGLQILGNIAMFCPIGFLLGPLLKGEFRLLKAVLISAFLSCVIEILQLITMRGMFEIDDIFSNSLGALSGWLAYEKVGRKTAQIIVIMMGTVAVLAIAIVCAKNSTAESDYSNALCFQIDSIEGGLASGFVLRFGRNTPEIYSLLLQSTDNGEFTELDTVTGLERTDVEKYFSCEYFYGRSGFETRIGKIDDEYEFVVRVNPLLKIPTGVYISKTGIHYASGKNFIPPQTEGTELEKIVKNGVLRSYRPDHHCWVYQYGWALYWIADEGFIFEEDGTTLIQYQLHTTQKDNLPQKRLENGWYWDNISGYFEKYEIYGDFGPYRVMKRDLPMQYTVTSVTTGYYKNGRWIWKDFFRPIYNFSEKE